MAEPHVVNVQFDDEAVDFGRYRHHFLAEGDSWFAWAHINLRKSSNLLEQLQFVETSVVVSCAYTGDVIRNMGDMASNGLFANEMRAVKYDAILLSGGGNDLIDALEARADVAGIIQARASGALEQAASYINAAALSTLLGEVLKGYQQIIAYRASTPNSNTPIVLHTYDYPTARNAPATFFGKPVSGPWLLPAMQAAAVPDVLQKAVTKSVYDQLSTALLTLHAPSNKVYVVRTTGTIEPAKAGDTGLSGDWINEIHPNQHGYALIAEKISNQLHQLGLA